MQTSTNDLLVGRASARLVGLLGQGKSGPPAIPAAHRHTSDGHRWPGIAAAFSPPITDNQISPIALGVAFALPRVPASVLLIPPDGRLISARVVTAPPPGRECPSNRRYYASPAPTRRSVVNVSGAKCSAARLPLAHSSIANTVGLTRLLRSYPHGTFKNRPCLSRRIPAHVPASFPGFRTCPLECRDSPRLWAWRVARGLYWRGWLPAAFQMRNAGI